MDARRQLTLTHEVPVTQRIALAGATDRAGCRADLVFKALADRSRRALLRRLSERDGQSTKELATGIGMGRFGVAKHFALLERAGLVTSHRTGRRRLHYLDTMPIHEV